MDYSTTLNNWMRGEYFNALPDEEQQKALSEFKDNYLTQNPDEDSQIINQVTEDINKRYLRGTGRGRAIPDLSEVKLPTHDKDWNTLSVKEKKLKIEEYESTIPDLANKFPTMREDAEFFFNRLGKEMHRHNEGAEVGRFMDHNKRAAWHGFVGGTLNYLGLPDASDAVRDYFVTNPKYDEGWGGALSQGVGDLGASMSIFIGSMAITRGLGGGMTAAATAGTSASLGTNAIMRYNEAYRNAIDAGLNPDVAMESGMSAVPAAFIDVIGDRILALKLFPVNVNKIFKTGTDAEKGQALKQLYKDNATRPKLMEVARASFSEGVTEVAADYYAARQPYLVSSLNEEFLPGDGDLFKSFVIGAVLGGGLAGTAMASRYVRNKEGIDGRKYANSDQRNIGEIEQNFSSIENNKEVFAALSEGQWGKAYDITRKVIETDRKREAEEAAQREAERQAVQDDLNAQAESGEININLAGEVQSVIEPDYVDADGVAGAATFNFVGRQDPRGQVYADLFSAVMEANDQVKVEPNQKGQRTQRLNQASPDRVRFASELNTAAEQSGIQKNQLPSVIAYADTLAAKWLSKNPDKTLNDFYKKINIKARENMRGFNLVVEAYKNKGESIIGITPKDDLNNLMGKMLTSFRQSGILAEILNEGEVAQLKESLGVTEFTNESDKELTAQFMQWLDSPVTGENLGGVFQKLKDWVSSIYGTLKMWAPRKHSMDAVFESLFQVDLSPGEYAANLQTPFSAEQQLNTTASPRVAPPAEGQRQVAVAPANQTGRKAKSKAKVQQLVGTPVEAQPAQQTPIEFLKGKKWAKKVLADLDKSNPNLRVVIGSFNFEGKYDKGVIYIDKDIAANPKELERVFKHEAGHAMLADYITSLVGNIKGEALIKKLKALQKDQNVLPEIRGLIEAYFHAAKELNINVGQITPKTRADYRFIDLHEFISEALSDHDFQVILAGIKYKNKSVFQQLIDSIKAIAEWATGYTQLELLDKSKGQNVLAEVFLATSKMIQNAQEGGAIYDPPFSPRFSPKQIEAAKAAGYTIPLYTAQRSNALNNFNFSFVGSNEGFAALGPGIYLLDNSEMTQHVYGKRGEVSNVLLSENAFILDITSIDQGYWKTATEKLDAMAKEIGYESDRGVPEKGVSGLKHGRGGIGKYVVLLGKEKARQLFIKHGIHGAKEELPGGAFEYAIFDPNKIKSANEITVDNEGNPIPSNQRYQQDSSDVRFSPKDLLKATDEKNPASVMQKFVDMFKSKIAKEDTTLEDANNIADNFITEVWNWVYKNQSKIAGAEVSGIENANKEFTLDVISSFGEEINISNEMFLTGEPPFVLDLRKSWQQNAETLKKNVTTSLPKSFFADVRAGTLRGIQERSAREYSHALNNFMPLPTGNTLSASALMTVSVVNEDGVTVKEKYDPENPIHDILASEETRAFHRMSDADKARMIEKTATKISEERLDVVLGLITYLYDNESYTSIEKAILLSASLKFSYTVDSEGVKIVELTTKNELLPAITGGDSAALAEAIKTESSLKASLRLAVENNIKFSQQQNSEKSGWIRREKSSESSEHIGLLEDCAGTPWCIARSESHARHYLSDGFFDILYVDGRPQVGIGTVDGRITEIRGTLDDQSLTPEQEQWAMERVTSADYTGGEAFLSDMQLKKDLLKIIREKDADAYLKVTFEHGDRPKKKFRGALGYGSTGEFSDSVYNALNDVAETIPQDTIYETDEIYFVPPTVGMNVVLPKVINKKYIKIKGGILPGDAVITGEDVDVRARDTSRALTPNYNDVIQQYKDRKAGIKNHETITINADTLSLGVDSVNVIANAKKIKQLYVTTDTTGEINADSLTKEYTVLTTHDVKINIKDLLVAGIENSRDVTVQTLKLQGNILRSKIKFTGEGDLDIGPDSLSVSYSTITSESKLNIHGHEGESGTLKLRGSSVTGVTNFEARELQVDVGSTISGDSLTVDTILGSGEKQENINFSQVSARIIDQYTGDLNITSTRNNEPISIRNSSIRKINVESNPFLHLTIIDTQIDSLNIQSNWTAVNFRGDTEVNSVKSNGHVSLTYGLTDTKMSIAAAKGRFIGKIESVQQVEDPPDANGGFLSPKFEKEKAFDRRALDEESSKSTPNRLFTEIDSYAFLAMAEPGNVDSSVEHSIKNNIKFDTFPRVTIQNGAVVDSANAEIAEHLLQFGYSKIPVIVEADFDWDGSLPSLLQVKEDVLAFPFNPMANISYQYPQIPDTIRQEYLNAYLESDAETARKRMIEAADIRGFETTELYRADYVKVGAVDRPLYLTPVKDVALEIADRINRFTNLGVDSNSLVHPFFVRKGLNLAKIGDTVTGQILKTSSYMYSHTKSHVDYRTNNKLTPVDLRVEGYDGAEGTIHRDGGAEIVIINPSDVKSADTFTHSLLGVVVDLNDRFSDAADVRYSPKAQFFADNAASIKKYHQIKQFKLDDKRDSYTSSIVRLVRSIKESDLMTLAEDELAMFFGVINEVYNSRKKGIKNPMNRVDSEQVIAKLEALRDMIEDSAVEAMLAEYDGLIDFTGLDLDTISKLDLQEHINANMSEEQIEAAANRHAKGKARQQKIFEAYRKRIHEAQQILTQRFRDAQDYLTQLEQVNDNVVVEEKVRLAVMLHYDYLTNAQVESKSGNDLYNHHFAITNLLDGNITYVAETTVKHLVASKDTADALAPYISMFRDPFMGRFAALKALDKINALAEILPTRLQRITVFEKARTFLLNDLFGGLVQGILHNAASRKKAKLEQYKKLILSLEEKTGRRMTAEDRFMISTFARLVQHRYDQDSDSALKQNINKELESIDNVKKKKVYKEATLFEEVLEPLFLNAIDGLEGQGSMDKMVNEMSVRLMGSDTLVAGEARADFIQGMIDLFYDFSLESKIISEGFHATPFTEYAHYVPNPVEFAEGTSDAAATSLRDQIENLHTPHRNKGIKVKSSHFFGRQRALGDNKNYSYNPDYVVDRQLEIFTVDAATIFDRFVIAERLEKDNALAQVIAVEEDGSYHGERVSHLLNLAKELVENATSRSEPKNLITNGLRAFVNMNARVTLSSIHHIISQPLAGMFDYAVRENDVTGWFKAATYYAANRDKVEAWLATNAAALGDRGALEAMALDYRKMVESGINIKDRIPQLKMLDNAYTGASNIITFFIRNGDKFGSRSVTLAYYMKLMQEKDPTIKEFSDLDWDNPDMRTFGEAQLRAEQNINASNKITRGEFFTDRKPTYSAIRNLIMAFAAHPASLATQMNMAVRDVVELAAQGQVNTPDMAAKIRTIGAITAQTIAFATSRFVITAFTTKMMISLLSELFDDEEEKLAKLEEKLRLARIGGENTKIVAAQEELQIAKDVRSVMIKMQNQYRLQGFAKSGIRDMMGVVYFGLNSPAVMKIEPVTTFFDRWGAKLHAEAREETLADYDKQIKAASDSGKFSLANRLKEEKFNYQQYDNIPITYDNRSGLDVGGAYGAFLGNINRASNDAIDGMLGVKEYNWNDMLIMASILGLGQSEVRKLLTNWDRIENNLDKTSETFQERKEQAVIDQQNKEDKARQKILDSLLR